MWWYRLVQVLLWLGTFALSVHAKNAHRRAISSNLPPIPVPYNITKFSLAAALVQQSYCDPESYGPGLHVGDAELLQTIGDGDKRQRVLLYHSEGLGIVVAYMGTNDSSLQSSMNDFLFLPEPANDRYRHNMPGSVRLMHGFQQPYVDLVDDVQAAITQHKTERNESRVTVIGQSQGAAIGLLSAVDFHQRLDGGIYRAYLFGLPRLGNPVFANYVDKTIGDRLRWVVNGHDWVPNVPLRIAGYQHPSNYVWIFPANSSHWKLYPGQENIHGFASVPLDYFKSWDHEGVYFHTQVGTIRGRCPAVAGQDFQ